jgi:hypothetical protein
MFLSILLFTVLYMQIDKWDKQRIKETIEKSKRFEPDLTEDFY